MLVGGTDVGDVIIGAAAGQYLKWDKSAGQVLANLNTLLLDGSAVELKATISGTAAILSLQKDDTHELAKMVSGSFGSDLYGLISAYYYDNASGNRIDSIVMGSFGGPQLQLERTALSEYCYLKYASGWKIECDNTFNIITNAGDIALDPFGGDVTCDGNFSATAGFVNASGGFKDNGTAGVDGTFVDNNGNTITVSGGIITDLIT